MPLPAPASLSRPRRIAYGIAGVLLLLLVALLIYLQLLPEATVPPAEPEAASIEGLQSSEAGQKFAVEVLDDPRYQALDRSLLDAGRLPVPAPAERGKLNLF